MLTLPGGRRAASLTKLTHSDVAMAAPLHRWRERAEGTTHTGGGEALSAVGGSARAQPSAAHTCRDHTGHPRAWGHVLAGALSRAPKGDGLAGRRLSQLNESPPTWHGGNSILWNPSTLTGLNHGSLVHPQPQCLPGRAEEGPRRCLLLFLLRAAKVKSSF